MLVAQLKVLGSLVATTTTMFCEFLAHKSESQIHLIRAFNKCLLCL